MVVPFVASRAKEEEIDRDPIFGSHEYAVDVLQEFYAVHDLQQWDEDDRTFF